MIGWINLSVESFICDTFGRDVWAQIIKQAHTDTSWVSSCPYPDKVTYDLVITGAGILGVTVPQALEAYGLYFVNYVIKQGYTRLMRSLGENIATFLANLNNLHLHLSMGFPAMVAPAFRVEQVTSTSLLLHYYSIRPALWPIVVGVLKGACQELFKHEVQLELLQSREAGDSDHEVFQVTFPEQESLKNWSQDEVARTSLYAMPHDFFYEHFPFHLIIDRECRVVQLGSVLRKLFGSTLVPGSHISATFKLRHPYIPLEFERMVQEADSVFLLKALETGLELKGQMIKTVIGPKTGEAAPPGAPAPRDVLLFLCSPRLATLDEMQEHRLYLSDIPLHDLSRDFVLLAEQRQAEAELKERFEMLTVDLRVANERLAETTSWLNEEKKRSEALLYRMLPADIAQDLREGRKVEAINYPEVTILFSDIVGFTITSAKSTAEEVYKMLNDMYERFDAIVDQFPDIYKLETIGDAYMLVCNLTTDCHDHVDTVIDFAIRMQDAARHIRTAQGEPVQIRIGIHTGAVVGGVMGTKAPRFSIYGDTVNVASRMESHGLPGKVHISGESYQRIVNKDKYTVRERGNIQVKGKGNMQTYLIGGNNDDWLLRHNSFDQQIDRAYLTTSRDRGGGAVSREGSFSITPSAKSDHSLSTGRLATANMEAIKEGDEDRGSRPSTLASLTPNGQSSALMARSSLPHSHSGGALASAGGLSSITPPAMYATSGSDSMPGGSSGVNAYVRAGSGGVAGAGGAPVSGQGGAALDSSSPAAPASLGGPTPLMVGSTSFTNLHAQHSNAQSGANSPAVTAQGYVLERGGGSGMLGNLLVQSRTGSRTGGGGSIGAPGAGGLPSALAAALQRQVSNSTFASMRAGPVSGDDALQGAGVVMARSVTSRRATATPSPMPPGSPVKGPSGSPQAPSPLQQDMLSRLGMEAVEAVSLLGPAPPSQPLATIRPHMPAAPPSTPMAGGGTDAGRGMSMGGMSQSQVLQQLQAAPSSVITDGRASGGGDSAAGSDSNAASPRGRTGSGAVGLAKKLRNLLKGGSSKADKDREKEKA